MCMFCSRFGGWAPMKNGPDTVRCPARGSDELIVPARPYLVASANIWLRLLMNSVLPTATGDE